MILCKPLTILYVFVTWMGVVSTSVRDKGKGLEIW